MPAVPAGFMNIGWMNIPTILHSHGWVLAGVQRTANMVSPFTATIGLAAHGPRITLAEPSGESTRRRLRILATGTDSWKQPETLSVGLWIQSFHTIEQSIYM